MEKLVVPAEVLAHLPNLQEHVELCDEEGRTLGFFLPPDVHHEVVYAWAKSLFSEEEMEPKLEEMKKEGGGMTTAEAIAYIEGLAGSQGAV